jgi:hypothetical protein
MDVHELKPNVHETKKIALTFRLVPKQKCEANIYFIFSLKHAKIMRNASGFLQFFLHSLLISSQTFTVIENQNVVYIGKET